MKLSEVAEKLSCRLEGDPNAEVTGISGMDHASGGQITFLANRRYFPLLHTTRATAIFIEDGIRIERDPGLPPLAALRSNNPYLAFIAAQKSAITFLPTRTPWFANTAASAIASFCKMV